MKKLEISSGLQEKIYDLQSNVSGKILKITTYFPLTSQEKLEILNSAEINPTVDFKSIFSDVISQQDWIKTKEQIKKKFQDELMDID